MADACARAFEVTGDSGWLEPLERAVDWFTGSNDAGLSMIDPRTTAGSTASSAGA